MTIGLLSRVNGLALAAAFLAISPARAADDPIPLRDWPVPAAARGAGRSPISPLAGLATSQLFIPITPCRVVDTRTGSGFTGPYGPPSLAAGSPRSFALSSICGLPPYFGAVSINVTVTNTQGYGDLRAYPGGTPPLVSVINFVPGQTIANATIVPTQGGGSLSILADVSGTDLVLDVNGYFTENEAVSLSGNLQEVLLDVYNSGGSLNSSAIWATASGAAYTTIQASHSAASGATSSGFFSNASIDGGAAGLQGRVGPLAAPSAYSLPSGEVAGLAGVASGSSTTNIGVLGLGTSRGVVGRRIDGTGAAQTSGVLGYTGNIGVFSFQDTGAVGTKNFVEPHPTDPGLVIKYTSLEGPEAGTYFRGRGRFAGRKAVIEVPEDFRIVTDEEGLSVQVTPIGALATVAVVRIGLDAIEVISDRDVPFFYTVNGVRKAFKDRKPIVAEAFFFAPTSPNDRLENVYNDELRKRLVANGTFNADGSVNVQTAERMGWAREWRDREAAARAYQAEHPQAAPRPR